MDDPTSIARAKGVRNQMLDGLGRFKGDRGHLLTMGGGSFSLWWMHNIHHDSMFKMYTF